MGTFRLSTAREIANPVRVQQWNATMRAGDDFKLALTVYADDLGTLADVTRSRSRLVLTPDWRHGSRSCDYGLGWFTGGATLPGYPLLTVDGYPTDFPGRINFFMPAATTLLMWIARYRVSLQVDLWDGEFSQVEGILQVREAWGASMSGSLGHAPFPVFTLDVSVLDGPDVMPPLVNVGGVAVDVDGFPL